MEVDRNLTFVQQTSEESPCNLLPKKTKFPLVIKTILKQMRKHYITCNNFTQKILEEILKILLQKEITELIKGKKYMHFKLILRLYREQYPIECDYRLITKLVTDIEAGRYELFVKSLTSNQIIDREIDDKPIRIFQLRPRKKRVPKKRGARADGPRLISPEPKFTLVIKKLVKQMKKHFYNFNPHVKDIEELLKTLLHKDLLVLLKGKKEYMHSSEILPLYRVHYPEHCDKELIAKLVCEVLSKNEQGENKVNKKRKLEMPTLVWKKSNTEMDNAPAENDTDAINALNNYDSTKRKLEMTTPVWKKCNTEMDNATAENDTDTIYVVNNDDNKETKIEMETDNTNAENDVDAINVINNYVPPPDFTSTKKVKEEENEEFSFLKYYD